MPKCALLSDDANSIELIDSIMRSALTEVFEDLNRFDWYVREREIVNLFAFGHMVPLFSQHDLDLTMMGVEFPVLQADGSGKNHGAPKDFVIWPEARTTLWKGCDVSTGMDYKQLRGPGRKPFAIVEWKNISRVSGARRAKKVHKEHADNKQWLQSNVDGGMLTVGYAVLTEWEANRTKLRCCKVVRRSQGDFLSLPAAVGQRMSLG